jgi:hypothetical protein
MNVLHKSSQKNEYVQFTDMLERVLSCDLSVTLTADRN